MKLLVLALVALLLAALATWLSQFYGGEIIVHIGATTARASLLMASLIGLAALSSFFLILWTLTYLLKSPGQLRRQHRRHRKNRAQSLFARGLRTLLLNSPEQALKDLERATQLNPEQPLFHLMAANAGVLANQPESWRSHLRELSEPEYQFAASLLRLDGLVARAEWEEALAVLQSLKSDQAEHPRILRHLARCHRELRNYSQLLELSQSTPARTKLSDDEVRLWAREALLFLLKQTKPEALPNLWGQLGPVREDPKVLRAYIAALRDTHQSQPKLEAFLRKQLDAELNDDTIELYVSLPNPNGSQLMSHVTRWLTQDPHRIALLRAQARLLIEQGQAEQARQCLETAMQHDPDNAEVCRDLAQVFDQLNQSDTACQYFRRSLISGSA